MDRRKVKRNAELNPNWKGGISLDRRKYEKEYWMKHKKERALIAKKCYQKNKTKYHKTRQKRYNTEEFIIQRKLNDQKRRLREYPILFNKKELKELIRQSHNCYYCKTELNGKFEIEHKIPISRGGINIINNLAISCIKCNRSKGTKTEKEFMEVYH